MSTTIRAAVAAIEKACANRGKNLEEYHQMRATVQAENEKIKSALGTATAASPSAATGSTATKPTPTPKPTGAQLLAQYRSLSGEARQKFFDVHQNELWEAHRLERASTPE